MFDYKELKLQIKRVFDTQDAFAEAMGMSKTAADVFTVDISIGYKYYIN